MSKITIDIFNGIFTKPNTRGYRVHISHRAVQPLYERYKVFKHIPPHQTLTDDERFEFEEYMSEHFANVARKYCSDELREIERIDDRYPPFWIKKQGNKYKAYTSFANACADIPSRSIMAALGENGIAATFEAGAEQWGDGERTPLERDIRRWAASARAFAAKLSAAENAEVAQIIREGAHEGNVCSPV